MAAELSNLRVAAIFAVTPVAALAAKHATKSIPIIFVLGSDPVKDGLVKSLSRPEGNITGVTFFSNLLVQKRMELLHELLPNATAIALLLKFQRIRMLKLEMNQTSAAAQTLDIQLTLLQATNESEIDIAFVGPCRQHIPYNSERRCAL